MVYKIIDKEHKVFVIDTRIVATVIMETMKKPHKSARQSGIVHRKIIVNERHMNIMSNKKDPRL